MTKEILTFVLFGCKQTSFGGLDFEDVFDSMADWSVNFVINRFSCTIEYLHPFDRRPSS